MLFLMPNLLTATTDIAANVPLQKLLMYQLLHHKLPQNLLQRLLLLNELKRQKIQSTAHIKTESQRNACFKNSQLQNQYNKHQSSFLNLCKLDPEPSDGAFLDSTAATT